MALLPARSDPVGGILTFLCISLGRVANPQSARMPRHLSGNPTYQELSLKAQLHQGAVFEGA